MRDALSAGSQETVRKFAASRALLAFDFDGTLAPIFERPEDARMRAATRGLLARLARARTCAVVSGRSRTDLRRVLAGTGIRHLVGNHGAEPWQGGAALASTVAQWRSALAGVVSGVDGAWIENKGLSLTVHYRQAQRKREVRSAILSEARMLADARVVGGKMAVSIIPREAPDKGEALKAEMARLGFRRALYVGDDDTDEDVFALAGPLVLTIRIGRDPSSRAEYFLRGQREVDALLRLLLHAADVRP